MTKRTDGRPYIHPETRLQQSASNESSRTWNKITEHCLFNSLQQLILWSIAWSRPRLLSGASFICLVPVLMAVVISWSGSGADSIVGPDFDELDLLDWSWVLCDWVSWNTQNNILESRNHCGFQRQTSYLHALLWWLSLYHRMSFISKHQGANRVRFHWINFWNYGFPSKSGDAKTQYDIWRKWQIGPKILMLLGK